MANALRAAIGRAPGKLILAGEHAVVHGRPAVAMPWPAVEAVAEARPAEGALTVTSERPELDVSGLRAAAAETLARFGRSAEGLAIHVRSTVPAGAGLGSSAATAVAVVRATAAACGETLAAEDLAALADIAERHAHGLPSGVDVAAVAAPGPIFFMQGHPTEAIAPAFEPALVVADSGRPRDTRAAVAAVRARQETAPEAFLSALDLLGSAAVCAASALRTADPRLLGEAFDRAQSALHDLGVSDPALEALIKAARAAGATGAKLTGAGRGGCVVALAPDLASRPTIAAAMRDAGAVRVWTKEGAA